MEIETLPASNLSVGDVFRVAIRVDGVFLPGSTYTVTSISETISDTLTTISAIDSSGTAHTGQFPKRFSVARVGHTDIVVPQSTSAPKPPSVGGSPRFTEFRAPSIQGQGFRNRASKFKELGEMSAGLFGGLLMSLVVAPILVGLAGFAVFVAIHLIAGAFGF